MRMPPSSDYKLSDRDLEFLTLDLIASYVFPNAPKL